MKHLKHYIALALGLFLFCYGNIAVQASTEIKEKSLEELYQDAKAGISDLKTRDLKASTILNIAPENSLMSLVENTPKVETYVTAQILKTSEDSQYIAVTTFNDVFFDEPNNYPGNITSFGSGSKNGNKMDSTESVQAYSTIYYETKTVSNVPYARLTKTTGGWKILESGFTTSNRYVVYGTSGLPAQGNPSRRADVGSTFSLTPSPAFSFVNTNTSYAIGMNSSATVKRGTGSGWNLYLVNNIP